MCHHPPKQWKMEIHIFEEETAENSLKGSFPEFLFKEVLEIFSVFVFHGRIFTFPLSVFCRMRSSINDPFGMVDMCDMIGHDFFWQSFKLTYISQKCPPFQSFSSSNVHYMDPFRSILSNSVTVGDFCGQVEVLLLPTSTLI